MKKRFLFLLLLFDLAVLPVARADAVARRAMFVSVIQNPSVLSSRAEVRKMVDFAKKAKVRILFVQVYRSNQAWFPSKIADDQPYTACRKSVGEDPLAFLIREAHREKIEVHAWMNLLSLGTNVNAPFLKRYGPEILTRNTQFKRRIEDYKIDSQYFLEPGDPRVQEGLAQIEGEVLEAYPDLDGIQFDYIRYPDMKPHYGYTKMNMDRFKKETGARFIDDQGELWQSWKRRQVTALLERLVQRARQLRPRIQVSATGCMPYSRAYQEAFQDWPSWLERGIVDFVTIMNYSPDSKEFEKWIITAKAKTKNFNKVKIGVGAYKLVHMPGVFRQEFRSCEAQDKSCVIFHYGSVLESKNIQDFLIHAQ